MIKNVKYNTNYLDFMRSKMLLALETSNLRFYQKNKTYRWLLNHHDFFTETENFKFHFDINEFIKVFNEHGHDLNKMHFIFKFDEDKDDIIVNCFWETK